MTAGKAKLFALNAFILACCIVGLGYTTGPAAEWLAFAAGAALINCFWMWPSEESS
jgi:hypothetical protein